MFAFFLHFISFLHQIQSSFLSFIYDLIFSKPVTGFTYNQLLKRLKSQKILEKTETILDVGVGTGTALEYIISEIPKDIKIDGVDLNEHYVDICKKKFERHSNVNIELKNFYDLENENRKYDLVLFTSSFMLLPDRDRALQIAKKMLKKNGKVYFILTLFENRKSLVELCKPLLKYVLTVDFGVALTESQFLDILKKNGIKVGFKERVKRRFFPCFRVFRYFLVEGTFEE